MPDVTPAGAPGNMNLIQVTIASGGSASEMVATQGRALMGIFTDTAGWTAAAIGFKVGWDGQSNNLVTAYDNAKNYVQALVSVDAASAGVFVAAPQADTLFAPFIQITSRTAGTDTAQTQGAARVLTLVFRSQQS